MPVFDFRLGASLLSIINLSFLVCSALQSVPVPIKTIVNVLKKSIQIVRQDATVKVCRRMLCFNEIFGKYF